MRNAQYSLASLGVLLVALHFVVSAVHGAAHLNLHIDLNTWQTVYVLVYHRVASRLWLPALAARAQRFLSALVFNAGLSDFRPATITS